MIKKNKNKIYTINHGDYNIFDILENDLNNMNNVKNKNNKLFTQILEKELSFEYEDTHQNFECPSTLEGIGGVAWFFCNQKYREMPSSIFVEKKYNIDVIDYMKKNASTVYRKIYDSEEFSEIQYIFLYNKCYYTFNINFDNEDSYLISGFGVYHPISIVADYSEFKKYEHKEEKIPRIGIIKTARHGPSVTFIDHKTDMKFSFDNYNEDFSPFFEDLKQKLTGDVRTGLYLFYGEAGTGKSSAIRHLITEVDRRVVFLPPQMINCLSSPDFTDLVTSSLKNSILVIEDAEKALMKRESEDGFFNSELVSSVLNLTDGLYADLAQTAIIATYNCDRNLVDPALLRKGRLRSEYHFNKLSIDRSQKLMDNLGHDTIIKEPMSLADIFNYQKQYSNKKEEKKRAVGFGG